MLTERERQHSCFYKCVQLSQHMGPRDRTRLQTNPAHVPAGEILCTRNVWGPLLTGCQRGMHVSSVCLPARFHSTMSHNADNVSLLKKCDSSVHFLTEKLLIFLGLRGPRLAVPGACQPQSTKTVTAE